MAGSVTDAREEPRPNTRVLIVFDLVNRLRAARELSQPVHTKLDFDRFTRHLEPAADLLPAVVAEEWLEGSRLEIADLPEPLGLSDVRLLVGVTPRADITLVLDCGLTGDPAVGDVTRLLTATCYHKEGLLIDGEPFLSWVRDCIGAKGVPVTEDLAWGRNVHQMVFPGGSLVAEITAGDEPTSTTLSRLVYRDTVSDLPLPVHRPSILNVRGRLVVAHGHGVSVVAGWKPHIELCLGLIAVNLFSAMGVLQRARMKAFDALRESELQGNATGDRSRRESIGAARSLVTKLSAQLNDVELDLSFVVEADTDSVLIPELVPDAFLSSMREALGLTMGLENTSRMLNRLQTVIQTRSGTLERAVQEEAERRTKVFSAVVAVGSLVALPPTLLLGFFGANSIDVDESRSLVDVPHYWAAYLVAWLPFVILVVLGFVMSSRIRAASPSLRQYEQLNQGAQGATGMVEASAVAPRPPGQGQIVQTTAD